MAVSQEFGWARLEVALVPGVEVEDSSTVPSLARCLSELATSRCPPPAALQASHPLTEPSPPTLQFQSHRWPDISLLKVQERLSLEPVEGWEQPGAFVMMREQKQP